MNREIQTKIFSLRTFIIPGFNSVLKEIDFEALNETVKLKCFWNETDSDVVPDFFFCTDKVVGGSPQEF